MANLHIVEALERFGYKYFGSCMIITIYQPDGGSGEEGDGRGGELVRRVGVLWGRGEYCGEKGMGGGGRGEGCGGTVGEKGRGGAEVLLGKRMGEGRRRERGYMGRMAVGGKG